MAGIAILAFAYILSQFYRSFLAVLTPVLTTELGMSKTELSLASGAWFAVFALMQFVVGVALDRYGPRRTAAFLLVFGGGGGALLFAVATAPWVVIAAMALNGAGCAAVLMASVFIFAKSFSPARLAVLVSSIVGFGTIGNVASSMPLAAAVEAFGWREVVVGLAVVTILSGLAIHVLVRDPDRAEEKAQAGSGFGGYLELMRLRYLWPILPLAAFNYAPAMGIRGLWAGPYLSEVFAADALLIGQVTFFMALAMAAGNLAYGPMDSLFGTRKWVAVFGNLPALLVIVALALLPMAGIAFAVATFAIIGVCAGAYGLLMAHGRAFIPAHLTGRGVTLLNFFSIGGAAIMQFATGGVVAASAVPGDPVAAYRALFWFYAATLGAATAIYLFSRDAPPEKPVRR